MEMCPMKTFTPKGRRLGPSHEGRSFQHRGSAVPLVSDAVPSHRIEPKKDSCVQRCGTGKFQRRPFIRYNTAISARGAVTRPTYLSRNPPFTVSRSNSLKSFFSCHDIGRTALAQCPTTNGSFKVPVERGWMTRHQGSHSDMETSDESCSPKGYRYYHYSDPIPGKEELPNQQKTPTPM